MREGFLFGACFSYCFCQRFLWVVLFYGILVGTVVLWGSCGCYCFMGFFFLFLSGLLHTELDRYRMATQGHISAAKSPSYQDETSSM
jgi:hypothetical protein